MEPKKTSQADVHNKSFLFFNIGLVASLSLMILAFNYKVSDNSAKVELVDQIALIEETIEPPVTEQLPPPPAMLMQPEVVEVPNQEVIQEEIKINMDIETHVDQAIAEVAVIVQPVIEEDKEDPQQIFTIVEEIAVPVGGLAAFYEYVKGNLKYPVPAKRMELEGKVFVQFIVEKDGSIADVQAIKGIGGGCDEEAIRVVANAAKWNPAKQRGKPVRQRMVLPITFIMAKR